MQCKSTSTKGSKRSHTLDLDVQRATLLFRAADQLLHFFHFFRYAGGKNFRTIVGNQDRVFHSEVHLLVGELNDRFHRYHLAGLDWARWPHHVMGGQPDKMSGES